MDALTRRALDAIDDCVAEGAPGGPVVLTPEYLRALKLAEGLPANQPRSDKTWTERALSEWRRALAGVRRVPVG